MAERQKAQPLAWGAKTVTPIAITDEAGITTNINAVIENVTPSRQANVKELPDGVGGVQALVYSNRRTTLSVDFWCAETDIATAKSRQNTLIEPGDNVTFTNPDIPEIDDASHTFLVVRSSKKNQFGDVRMISLELVEYETSLSDEVQNE